MGNNWSDTNGKNPIVDVSSFETTSSDYFFYFYFIDGLYIERIRKWRRKKYE